MHFSILISFPLSSDDCQLSQDPGPCRGNMRRYYYDATQGRCLPFSYGGCQGNQNNFADETSCMEACRDVRVERPVTRYPSRGKSLVTLIYLFILSNPFYSEFKPCDFIK